ncbi:hypothetical protein E2C01_055255 [Portunus trituberculatus]|uniref:Uncharacterized protein n=1 Tax=Portunus trituberculatus TaxID=210409 RepID=A0A5B7GM02_PORTR|nr:hypothetical protein [Portunus trituberculatus]
MYKIVNGIEKIGKEDLVLVTEEARTRGHVKKIRMRQCVKDIGKYSFPHRTVEKWNTRYHCDSSKIVLTVVEQAALATLQRILIRIA